MKKVVCLAALAISLGAQAQTVRFYKGSTEVNSWRRGDVITARVSGGSGTKFFGIWRQAGYANAPLSLIWQGSVRLPAGFNATFNTGTFTSDVSITVGYRVGNSWWPLRTLWRNG